MPNSWFTELGVDEVNQMVGNAPEVNEPVYNGDGGFLDSFKNAVENNLGATLESTGTYFNEKFGVGQGLINYGKSLQEGTGVRPGQEWDVDRMWNDPVGFVKSPTGLTTWIGSFIGSNAPDAAITAASTFIPGAGEARIAGGLLKAGRGIANIFGVGRKVLQGAETAADVGKGLLKAIGVGEKAAGVGMRGAKIIARELPASAIGGVLDSASEAGQAYNTAVEQGQSQEDALNAMNTNFGENIITSTVQNMAEMGMLRGIKGLPSRMLRSSADGATEASTAANRATGNGLLGSLAEAGEKVADFTDRHYPTRFLTRAVPGIGVEAYTEGLQNEFQENSVNNSEIHYNPLTMSKESRDQAIMAAISMAPFGGVSAFGHRRRANDDEIEVKANAIPDVTVKTNEEGGQAEGTNIVPQDEGEAPVGTGNGTEINTQPTNIEDTPDGVTPVATTPVSGTESPDGAPVQPTGQQTNTIDSKEFANALSSFMEGNDPIKGRTPEQLSADRANEATKLGRTSEEGQGRIRAYQDIADTIESMEPDGVDTPLTSTNPKKGKINKYLRDNYMGAIADTIGGGDKDTARNVINNVTSIMQARAEEAAPARRAKINEGKAATINEEGSHYGLGKVEKGEDGTYSDDAVKSYESALTKRKARVENENKKYGLAKERHDYHPDDDTLARNLLPGVNSKKIKDDDTKQKFLNDVHQTVSELLGYTKSPQAALNRVTKYFGSNVQKKAVQDAIVDYVNKRATKSDTFPTREATVNIRKAVMTMSKSQIAAEQVAIDTQRRREAATYHKNRMADIRNTVKNQVSKINTVDYGVLDKDQEGNSRSKVEELHKKYLEKANDLEDDIKKLKGSKHRPRNVRDELNRLLEEQTAYNNAAKKIKKALEKRDTSHKREIKKAGKDVTKKTAKSTKKSTSSKTTTTSTGNTREKAKKKSSKPVEHFDDDTAKSIAKIIFDRDIKRGQHTRNFRPSKSGNHKITDTNGKVHYYDEDTHTRISKEYKRLMAEQLKTHPGTITSKTKSGETRKSINEANKRAEILEKEKRLKEAEDEWKKGTTSRKEDSYRDRVKDGSLLKGESVLGYVRDVTNSLANMQGKSDEFRKVAIDKANEILNDYHNLITFGSKKSQVGDIWRLANLRDVSHAKKQLKEFYNKVKDVPGVKIPKVIENLFNKSDVDVAKSFRKMPHTKRADLLSKAVGDGSEKILKEAEKNADSILNKVSKNDSKKQVDIDWSTAKKDHGVYHIDADITVKDGKSFSELDEFGQGDAIDDIISKAKDLPKGFSTNIIKGINGNTVHVDLIYNGDPKAIERKVNKNDGKQTEKPKVESKPKQPSNAKPVRRIVADEGHEGRKGKPQSGVDNGNHGANGKTDSVGQKGQRAGLPARRSGELAPLHTDIATRKAELTTRSSGLVPRKAEIATRKSDIATRKVELAPRQGEPPKRIENTTEESPKEPKPKNKKNKEAPKVETRTNLRKKVLKVLRDKGILKYYGKDYQESEVNYAISTWVGNMPTKQIERFINFLDKANIDVIAIGSKSPGAGDVGISLGSVTKGCYLPLRGVLEIFTTPGSWSKYGVKASTMIHEMTHALLHAAGGAELPSTVGGRKKYKTNERKKKTFLNIMSSLTPEGSSFKEQYEHYLNSLHDAYRRRVEALVAAYGDDDPLTSIVNLGSFSDIYYYPEGENILAMRAIMFGIADSEKATGEFCKTGTAFQEYLVSLVMGGIEEGRQNAISYYLDKLQSEPSYSKSLRKEYNDLLQELTCRDILENVAENEKSNPEIWGGSVDAVTKIFENACTAQNSIFDSITEDSLAELKKETSKYKHASPSRIDTTQLKQVVKYQYGDGDKIDNNTAHVLYDRVGINPISEIRDSIQTYGRGLIQEENKKKGKYHYHHKFWRTAESVLKEKIGGRAADIFKYGRDLHYKRVTSLNNYLKKYTHIYHGLSKAEHQALNRMILYCNDRKSDPIQVVEAGKNRFVAMKDGDFIEAYSNVNTARKRMNELKSSPEFKNGDVKLMIVYGDRGLKATLSAVRDKDRVFDSKARAEAYMKKNYLQATKDMIDSIGNNSFTDEQKNKLAHKYKEYRSLMDNAWKDMVEVGNKYGVKIPPKQNGFFPRYHLPFVVMVNTEEGKPKRITSFYNRGEAERMAEDLKSKGQQAYWIEIKPQDQARVGIDMSGRDYLTQDEIAEIEKGKDISFANANEAEAAHAKGMKALRNLVFKRFNDGHQVVPTKVLLKDIFKALRGNKSVKRQIQMTGIVRELERHKTALLQREDVENILDRCNRHGVFNAHLLHRKDADGYSFNVENSIYRYLTDAASYVGNEWFKQEASKAYADRFNRDITLPAVSQEQAYVQQYVATCIRKRNVTAFDRAVDEFVKSIPFIGTMAEKWSPHPYTDAASNAINANNYLKLGMFRVSSVLVQMAQLLTANAKLGGAPGIGMSKAFRFGMKEAFKGKGMINDKRLNSNPIYKEIFDYIHLYDERPSIETELLGRPSSWFEKERKLLKGHSIKDLAEWSMYFFNRGDIKSRQATAIGAWYKFEHEMKDQKIKDYLAAGLTKEKAVAQAHHDMLEYVDEIVRKTNFDYAVYNTPLALSQAGVTGRLLMQFKKYSFFTLNFLADNTAAENARFIVPLILLSGVFGMPLAEIPEKIGEAATGNSPKAEIKKLMFEWAGNDPEKKALVNVATYGAFSLAGIDLSSRIGLGDALPTDLGPTISTTGKLYGAFKRGDAMAAAKALSPIANTVDSLRKGGYADSHGNLINQYDTYDKMLKLFGFQLVDDSKITDKKQIIAQSKRIMNDKIDEAKDEYRKNPTVENFKALKIYGLTNKQIANIKSGKQSKEDKEENDWKDNLGKNNKSSDANEIRELQKMK